MRIKYFFTALLYCVLSVSCICDTVNINLIGLKDIVEDKFLIGTALNVKQSCGVDIASLNIVKRHFNSIVAENCMKSAKIQPREGYFYFDDADRFVNLGLETNMFIVGHCLIWHSLCPDWFCTDDNGKNVSPEILRQRIKTHIYTVVGRYKGKVKGWDVVNEAILEDGSYRKSKFYEILGEEFVS